MTFLSEQQIRLRALDGSLKLGEEPMAKREVCRKSVEIIEPNSDELSKRVGR